MENLLRNWVMTTSELPKVEQIPDHNMPAGTDLKGSNLKGADLNSTNLNSADLSPLPTSHNIIQWDEPARIRHAIEVLNTQRLLLSDDVVDTALLALQKRLAEVGERTAPHQRKQATVLFADVSGFTALDLAILNRGGIIDKHIGDAVMALFGAPMARENDPELAVRAALDMQQELTDFNETLKGMGFQDANLRMRIGINTGSVLVGEVGTIGEYTAMGDAVNLASRLETSAPIGSILISQSTHRHITGLFATEAQIPLRVKGKSEPIQTYIVREAKASAYLIPNRGLEGITTRMIGRNEELDRLKNAYKQMQQQGRLYIASVVGEAGVGKSRMMDEFGKWLVSQGDQHTILHGRATLELLGQPYGLMRNVFSSRLGIRDSDSPADTRLILEHEIAQFMGEDSQEKAHFIGHLMGFNFSESPYIRGILNDVKQIRDRAFHYTAQLLRIQTNKKPFVIMLEDVHWADTGSLEMIDYLAAECPDIPLLIVAPMRATLMERWAQWGQSHQNNVQVILNPLSEEKSNHLIDEILRKAPEIPSALRELIITNADGNPFYIEELIKVLIEDGVITVGPQRWYVQRDLLMQVKIPPTLTALLQARLDRLQPDERIVLQQAAIVGKIFWEGAVESLYTTSNHHGESNLPYIESHLACGKALSSLLQKELIYVQNKPAFSSEREYIFSHAIMHQVVYESILKRERPAYHAQAARWLIYRSGENVGQYAARIAVHFEQAHISSEATHWYGQAANQARETYTPETAIEYYEKALEFYKKRLEEIENSEDTPDAQEAVQLGNHEIALYKGLGEMLHWQVQYENAEQIYQRMYQAASANHNLIEEAHAWNELSVIKDRQSDHHTGLKSAEEAYRLARLARDAAAQKPEELSLASIEEVTALLYMGYANHRLGNNEEALEQGEASIRLSWDLNDSRSIARSHNLLSITHMIFGNHEEAEKNLQASIQLFQELGDRRSMVPIINNLGKAASLRGEYGEAVKFFQDALTIAEEIGDRDSATVNLLNLGAAQNDQGEYIEAEKRLREVIERVESEDWLGMPLAHCVLAEALMGQNKLDEASIMANKSLNLALTTGLKEQIGLSWFVLGQISARMIELSPKYNGIEIEKPDSYFTNSLDVFTAIGAEADRAKVLWAWSKYEETYGDSSRAEKLRKEAEKLYKTLKLQPE